MVSTAEELNNIRNDTTAKYLLTCDINYEGDEWIPIDSFSGIIDGNGHKIYNFDMSGSEAYLGFININTGTIKNLNFDDFNFKHNYNVSTNPHGGVIVARNSGTIKNCTLIDGQIEFKATYSRYESYLGALVGYNTNTGIVSECVNNVDVLLSESAGISKYMSSAVGINCGIIEKTVTYGNITIPEIPGKIIIGGITAQNQPSAEIIECAAFININYSYAANGAYIGAIAGYNLSSITNCYAEGTINVTSTNLLSGYIGGAVGRSDAESSITNVYVDVDITLSCAVTSLGGIVGATDAGSVINKAVYIGNITVGFGTTKYGFIVGTLNGTTRNCYYDATNILTVGEGVITEGTCTDGTSAELSTLQSEDFIYNTLFWKSDIWQINDNEAPSLKCFTN